MAWFSLAKIALQAGAKIYSNRQKTKMAMSDAQLMHAERMAKGEEAYQGKLLEARQTDWKDEFVLIILSAPIIVLAWAVLSDDPAAMEKVKLFFEYFSTLPSWFTNLWILVVASIFGIKGTQIFRNGGKKMANKAIKGYKFVVGGKSRPGIVGVKPKSGGVVDEFKSRKLKQLGRTQRTLKSQDKQISTELDKAKKRGATENNLLKVENFKETVEELQERVINLKKMF